MSYLRRVLLLLLAATAFLSPAPRVDAVTIDFETLKDSEVVTTQLAGLAAGPSGEGSLTWRPSGGLGGWSWGLPDDLAVLVEKFNSGLSRQGHQRFLVLVPQPEAR